MEVFLVRHADPVEHGGPHRHLSHLGRAQAKALGLRLRWHDCHPTQIWSSPLVRAIQTAELIATVIDMETPVEAHAALAPDGDLAPIVAALRALPGNATALVVGHEPVLQALGARLTDAPFEFLPRAHAARIVDGRLRWRFAWDAEAPSVVVGVAR